MSKRKLFVVEGYVMDLECDDAVQDNKEFIDYEDDIYGIIDDLIEDTRGTGLKVFYMNKRTGYDKFRKCETVIAVGYPIFEGEGKLADGTLFTEMSREISDETESELSKVRATFKLGKQDAKTYLLDGRMIGKDDVVDWKDI